MRDDDAGLRALGPAVLARFPRTRRATPRWPRAVREAYEPRPWQLWAEDASRPATARPRTRGRRAGQLRPLAAPDAPGGPTPGWSVTAVLRLGGAGPGRRTPPVDRDQPAARCLAAVAGPEDRPELLDAALHGPSAARAAALRHLADRRDPEVPRPDRGRRRPAPTSGWCAPRVESFERMRGDAAMAGARGWAVRDRRRSAPPPPGCSPGTAARTTPTSCWPRCAASYGPAAPTPKGSTRSSRASGRLAACRAAPVLRHLYRETSSSQLRGTAARALAVADPGFAAGLRRRVPVGLRGEHPRTRRAPGRRHGDVRVLAQLRRLAADPAEEAEVQTAVRGRLSSGGTPR